MKIPLKLQILIKLKNISDFSIVRFQDKNLQNPHPHWYIIIPILSSDKFLVAIITSQHTKRAAYYKRTRQAQAADCLVRISNNEFAFLSEDCAINCNATEYLDIKEIVHKVDEDKDFKIEKEKVPVYLKKEIVSAIIKSPLTAKFIKKLAKESNPL